MEKKKRMKAMKGPYPPLQFIEGHQLTHISARFLRTRYVSGGNDNSSAIVEPLFSGG